MSRRIHEKNWEYSPRSICSIVGTTAALLGGAAIGAIGSMVAGNKAAGATTKSAATAAGVQREALAQSKELSAPYRALGEAAIPSYEDLLGIGGKGSAGILETLRNLPGYEFLKTEGEEAAKRGASSMGMALSGNTLKELQARGQGLADTTYAQRLAELEQPIGMGQAAAAGQAAASMQTGTNLANIAQTQGQNLANIGIGTIGGVTGAIGKGIDAYTTMNTLKGLGG